MLRLGQRLAEGVTRAVLLAHDLLEDHLAALLDDDAKARLAERGILVAHPQPIVPGGGHVDVAVGAGGRRPWRRC